MKRILSGVLAVSLSYTSVAQADAIVAVGVGNITNTFDSTSESFSLLRYLREHPLNPGAQGSQPVLVDHPADARVAVTGTIEEAT